MDIRQKLAAVSQDTPDACCRAHFTSIIDPLSEVSLLLANVYQYQASQPGERRWRRPAQRDLRHDVGEHPLLPPVLYIAATPPGRPP